jgi:hypothetical protein
MKKTLLITGITLVVLIIAMLIVPVIFKNKIIQKVKQSANN